MKLRLRTLRRINGYTQSDIAKYLNITQRTYSKYETGELSIKISQLTKLCNFYKVSSDYLLGLKEIDDKSFSSKTFKKDNLIKNLKYLRYEYDYSQKKLSELINCSPSLISMIERKESTIQIDMLVALAKTYNKSTDYLLYSNDN